MNEDDICIYIDAIAALHKCVAELRNSDSLASHEAIEAAEAVIARAEAA
jgi:hypothetical protein